MQQAIALRGANPQAAAIYMQHAAAVYHAHRHQHHLHNIYHQ